MRVAPRIRFPRIRSLLASLLFFVIAATGAVLWHSGYHAYIVHTNSMSPSYRSGDLVVDAPAARIRPGQVITFRHSALTTDVVTHRVVDLRRGVIHTKGDANPTADAWNIRPNQVRGVVTMRLPRIGYLLVFLQQRAGIAAVITATLALGLLWGLFFPTQPDSSEKAAPHVGIPAQVTT